MQQQPIVLRLVFAFELERAGHVVGKVIQPLKRQMWKCCHEKYGLTLLVLTEETPLALVQRLALDEIDAIVDYTAHVAPIGVITKYGGMNSFHTAITKAWDAVGQRRNPEYMRQTKRFDPRVERRVEDRERGAIRQMRIEPPSVRKPPKYPYSD
jgi:hypothetical protein